MMKLCLKMVLKLSVASALVVTSTPIFAWGPQGHETIATVARDMLAERNPKVANEIYKIIKEDNLYTVYTPKKTKRNPNPKPVTCQVRTIGSVANWPDCVRKSERYKYTAQFHFDDVSRCPAKDILPHKSTYCPDGKCGSAALNDHLAVLRDKTAPARKRSEALSFVIHIVGDLHQPMHAVENGNDQGGNLVSIAFTPEAFKTGKPNATNLHSLWDGDLVEEAIGLDAKAGIARVRQIANTSASQWENNEPDIWVKESHLHAEMAYSLLSKPPVCNAGETDGGLVNAAYAAKAASIVETRLAAASVRLAALLEAALSN